MSNKIASHTEGSLLEEILRYQEAWDILSELTPASQTTSTLLSQVPHPTTTGQCESC